MTFRSTLMWLALAALPAGAIAAAGHAHEHGAAKLDVAIDGPTLTVDVEMPLDNLIGFEHAPRNDAEQKTADAAVARFKAAEGLFKPDPAAGCKLTKVELESAALKLGEPDPAAANDGHADLDAHVTFTCTDTAKAGFMDVALFEAFARLQRVDVQVAGAKGQLKRTLKRGAARLSLR